MKNENFFQRIALLIIGFVLTAGVGNWITSEFQKRQFDYEHRTQMQESETIAATKTFEDVSKLMDERIYRMEKLNWELKDNKDLKKIDTQMEAYRESLYNWNDNRNRNVALINRYFGEKESKYFDADIHSAIKDTGKLLENYYYMPRWQRKEEMGWEIDGKMGDLENKSRELNINMLKLIQKQEVGIFNPEVKNN